jgi:hypothetical protein
MLGVRGKVSNSSVRQPRTTFFLGAGASAAVVNSPVLTQNLLRIALTDVGVQAAIPPADLAAVRRFVECLAPANTWPPIDDVLAVIDVALSQNLALSVEWSPARMMEVKRSFHTLIYACIQEVVSPRRARSGDFGTVALRRLVDPRLSPRPVVVSLNWDCLVERAFSAACNHRDDVIDYAVPSLTPLGKSRRRYSDALLLLKPHGSLSWGYCTFCSVLVTDVTDPFEFSTGRPCPKCVQPLDAVIVPPVVPQHVWPPFLPALWSMVEDEIEQTERLVFIGYSLPPQDTHVRVHLIRALARRAHRTTHPPVSVEVVVKKDPACPELVEIEKQRYKTVLGGLVPAECLQFFDEGLRGWMERCP